MRAATQQVAASVPAAAPSPPLRMKTRLGPVDDPLEREADRIADAVVTGRPIGMISGAAPAIAQRKCAACAAEEDKVLHRKETSQAATPQHATDAASTAVATGGTPLSHQQRAYFEPRLGRDLTAIRVHVHAQSSLASENINARAFAIGNNIGFASGEYRPDSDAGRRLLAHELVHTQQQERNPDKTIRRTLAVEKSADKIANSGGKSVTQTNAETAQKYLEVLCPNGKPTVAAGGDVSLSASICQMTILGISPLYGPTIPIRMSSLTSTPEGCGCLCDIVNSANPWTILIDDKEWPQTTFNDDIAARDPTSGGSGGRVTAPSPNSPKLWGAAAASGTNLDIDPWLVLGHELCGHAWMGNKGGHAIDEVSERGRGGHQATVARENLIREEHGIEDRGSFKDPNCGESYWRSKASPSKVNFSQSLEVCKAWRAEYNRKNKTKFKITDRIP